MLRIPSKVYLLLTTPDKITNVHRTAALFLALPLCAQTPSDLENFERNVRPVLVRACQPCHGPDQQFGKLRVDSREALLKGGAAGPAVVPGRSRDSILVQAIRHQGQLRMPQGGRLKDAEIDAIAAWVDHGAVWGTTAPKAASTENRYRQLARTHWAFQPVRSVSSASIDTLLEARLAKDNLTFANPADRRTLIRRVSYVLTGLPPAPADVDRFVRDPSPNAYEALVDRLLASPHFGEQWARHWMDLVRYGETRGYEWNYEILGAWRYRDYLIRAFNADVPYDQLVREHIAGDLLPSPRIDTAERINESIIGPAFFRLGEAGHDDCIQFREIATDVIDNQIDTLTKTFQGLTVSCARCHNHKLDPIPTEDYYGLYGVLNSSHHVTRSLDTPAANAAPIQTIRRVKEGVRKELAALWRTEIPAAIARALAKTSTKLIEDPAALWDAASKEPWDALQARYRKEAADRDAFNRTNFTELPLEEWRASGMGLRDTTIAAPGSFALAAEGDTIVTGIYPRGVYTHLESNRLNGAIRYPRLPAGRKRMSLHIAGGLLSSYRTIVDNCAIGEGYKLLDSPALAWQKSNLYDTQLALFPEILTRFDNPRIPDRPGMIKDEKLLAIPRSWFGVTRVVVHDVDESPRAPLTHLLPLLEGPQSQLAARIEAAAKSALDRWTNAASVTDTDVFWLDWLLRNGELTNRRDATPRLEQLIAEYRATESTITEPRVVDGLADIAEGRDFPVLRGGSPLSPGSPAPRAFLRYLVSNLPLTTHGSGRRELAERIAAPSNPLTARVMVNRLWHHVFGHGIVTTPDNFGTLGDAPSHPELLDALASRFVSGGWSIKRALREMVLSRAFRQANVPAQAARAAEVDPQNRLLHHYPVRRLTAEELRDSILVSSGALDEKLYGPSIDPYRDKPQDYRRLFSGPLDGAGRRSIYLKVTRMEGAKFLETFDYPNPMATVGARDVTNVPAQALTLLNDPFVIAQSAKLGDRVLDGKPFDERLDALFRDTLARTPDDVERERFRGLSRELSSLLAKPADSREVWSQLAHAALNLKEFLYIQ
jgi:mono/diheme cytochrome c family protein